MSDSLRPMDYSLSGSSVHGILQTILLDWVAIPFSRGTSQARDQIKVSHITGRFFTVWDTREARRPGFNPWIGKIPWRRKWQSTCLENSMDRGAWQDPVLGVSKSRAWLNDCHTHSHEGMFHTKFGLLCTTVGIRHTFLVRNSWTMNEMCWGALMQGSVCVF